MTANIIPSPLALTVFIQ